MDFVIHACVGGLIGRGLSPGEATPAETTGLVRLGALLALLPDADHVLELVSAEAYLIHHRSFSHSLLFAALGTAAVAGHAWRRGRDKASASSRVACRARVAGAAISSHLLLDVLTPFGTGLTWPFTGHMVALDGLMIIAPWLGLLCVITALTASLLARRGASAGAAPGLGKVAPPGRKAARIGLAVIAAFLLLELGVAGRTRAAVPGNVALATPSWKQPLAGVAFVVSGTRLVQHRVGMNGALEMVDPPERCRRDPPAHLVESSQRLAAKAVARLRLPVARRGDAPGTVVFEDAQFWSVDPAHPPFTVTVDPKAGTVVVHEQLRPLQLGIYLLVVFAVLGLTRRRRTEYAG